MVNSGDIIDLKKEAKHVQPMLKEISGLKINKANQKNMEFLSKHVEAKFTKIEKFMEFKKSVNLKISDLDAEILVINKTI